jgi:hypothetical protein
VEDLLMSVALKRFAGSGMVVAVLLLVGCSQPATPAASDTPVAAKPAGPASLVSAKTAFNPMYTSAVRLAPDVVLLSINPKEVPGFTNGEGKAAMWEAAFASPSLHKYRVDDYAIVTVLPSIHKGGSAGMPMPWGGATRDVMPVEVSNFTVDSDTAYKAAAAEAADWLKKNPDKKLSTIALGNTYKFQSPVWYVLWGDAKTGGYVAYVDASSGKVLKAKK